MPILRRTALLACLALAGAPAFATSTPQDATSAQLGAAFAPPVATSAPTAAVAQASLGPTGSWRAEAIGAAALPAVPRPDITFTAEGRAHGSSGCNRFMGGFTLDGATLRFSPIAGTRMACAAPAMEVEQHFLDALATTRGWRMDGAALLLTDDAGTTVLRLVRGEDG